LCFGRVVKAALSGLLVLLLLLVLALAVLPSLHHRLHADTNDPFCLVCSFAKGQVSAPLVAGVFVLAFVFLVGRASLPQSPPIPVFDFRLSPSRAPPVF
jgi:hypothetical protein